jgi:tetratricopeptide (TPR) repeat protein
MASRNPLARLSSDSWTRSVIPGALLVLCVVLAYLPALHAGFIWDDDIYVTNNPLLTAPDGLRRIWFSLDAPSQYFPLTYTAFRLEHAFWGFNPAGYHWVNLLLHTANSLLVWRLLKRLSVPGAWLGAALFALHPIQVESVAWVTEFKNVSSLFFILLSLLAWIEFVEERPKPAWGYYALALIFYGLALCGKTTACTLPAALLLILWLQHKAIGVARWLQVVPFVIVGLGMGLVTVWWERYHQGTEGGTFSISLVERFLIAGRAVWFYLGKLLWPANLSFSYPHWTINPANPLAYGWLAAVAALAVVIYLARRFFGRSVEVAALFYVATLVPMLGFFMLYTFRYTFVADHYQYVACIGPLALAAAGISIGLGRFDRTLPFLKPVVCGALVLVLGVLTWRQSATYADLETLWRTTAARNPGSWIAHNNLGDCLFRDSHVDEAITQYHEAIRIDPNAFETWNNLGLALATQGHFDEAIESYHKAIRILPNIPGVHNNLGVTFAAKGSFDEAIDSYRKAIEINPNYSDALDNLGVALTVKGQFDEAIESYRQAIQIDANRPKTYFHWGMALNQSGHTREAIAKYREALRLDPNLTGALNNLAWVLATSPDDKLRNGAEAVQLAEHACELTNHSEPLFIGTLAAAYAEAGRFSDAVTAAEEAEQLATTNGLKKLAEKDQQLLDLYRTGKAYHEPASTRQ